MEPTEIYNDQNAQVPPSPSTTARSAQSTPSPVAGPSTLVRPWQTTISTVAGPSRELSPIPWPGRAHALETIRKPKLLAALRRMTGKHNVQPEFEELAEKATFIMKTVILSQQTAYFPATRSMTWPKIPANIRAMAIYMLESRTDLEIRCAQDHWMAAYLLNDQCTENRWHQLPAVNIYPNVTLVKEFRRIKRREEREQDGRSLTSSTASTLVSSQDPEESHTDSETLVDSSPEPPSAQSNADIIFIESSRESSPRTARTSELLPTSTMAASEGFDYSPRTARTSELSSTSTTFASEGFDYSPRTARTSELSSTSTTFASEGFDYSPRTARTSELSSTSTMFASESSSRTARTSELSSTSTMFASESSSRTARTSELSPTSTVAASEGFEGPSSNDQPSTDDDGDISFASSLPSAEEILPGSQASSPNTQAQPNGYIGEENQPTARRSLGNSFCILI